MKSYFKRAIMFCSAVGLSLSMFAVSALANGGISTYDSGGESGGTSVKLVKGPLNYSTYSGTSTSFTLQNTNAYGQRIYIYATVTNGKLYEKKQGTYIYCPVGGTGSGSLYAEGTKADFFFDPYNKNVAGYKVTSYSAVN